MAMRMEAEIEQSQGEEIIEKRKPGRPRKPKPEVPEGYEQTEPKNKGRPKEAEAREDSQEAGETKEAET